MSIRGLWKRFKNTDEGNKAGWSFKSCFPWNDHWLYSEHILSFEPVLFGKFHGYLSTNNSLSFFLFKKIMFLKRWLDGQVNTSTKNEEIERYIVKYLKLWLVSQWYRSKSSLLEEPQLCRVNPSCLVIKNLKDSSLDRV